MAENVQLPLPNAESDVVSIKVSDINQLHANERDQNLTGSSGPRFPSQQQRKNQIENNQLYQNQYQNLNNSFGQGSLTSSGAGPSAGLQSYYNQNQMYSPQQNQNQSMSNTNYNQQYGPDYNVNDYNQSYNTTATNQYNNSYNYNQDQQQVYNPYNSNQEQQQYRQSAAMAESQMMPQSQEEGEIIEEGIYSESNPQPNSKISTNPFANAVKSTSLTNGNGGHHDLFRDSTPLQSNARKSELRAHPSDVRKPSEQSRGSSTNFKSVNEGEHHDVPRSQNQIQQKNPGPGLLSSAKSLVLGQIQNQNNDKTGNLNITSANKSTSSILHPLSSSKKSLNTQQSQTETRRTTANIQEMLFGPSEDTQSTDLNPKDRLNQIVSDRFGEETVAKNNNNSSLFQLGGSTLASLGQNLNQIGPSIAAVTGLSTSGNSNKNNDDDVSLSNTSNDDSSGPDQHRHNNANDSEESDLLSDHEVGAVMPKTQLVDQDNGVEDPHDENLNNKRQTQGEKRRKTRKTQNDKDGTKNGSMFDFANGPSSVISSGLSYFYRSQDQGEMSNQNQNDNSDSSNEGDSVNSYDNDSNDLNSDNRDLDLFKQNKDNTSGTGSFFDNLLARSRDSFITNLMGEDGLPASQQQRSPAQQAKKAYGMMMGSDQQGSTSYQLGMVGILFCLGLSIGCGIGCLKGGGRNGVGSLVNGTNSSNMTNITMTNNMINGTGNGTNMTLNDLINGTNMTNTTTSNASMLSSIGGWIHDHLPFGHTGSWGSDNINGTNNTKSNATNNTNSTNSTNHNATIESDVQIKMKAVSHTNEHPKKIQEQLLFDSNGALELGRSKLKHSNSTDGESDINDKTSNTTQINGNTLNTDSESDSSIASLISAHKTRKSSASSDKFQFIPAQTFTWPDHQPMPRWGPNYLQILDDNVRELLESLNSVKDNENDIQSQKTKTQSLRKFKDFEENQIDFFNLHHPWGDPHTGRIPARTDVEFCTNSTTMTTLDVATTLADELSEDVTDSHNINGIGKGSSVTMSPHHHAKKNKNHQSQKKSNKKSLLESDHSEGIFSKLQNLIYGFATSAFGLRDSSLNGNNSKNMTVIYNGINSTIFNHTYNATQHHGMGAHEYHLHHLHHYPGIHRYIKTQSTPHHHHELQHNHDHNHKSNLKSEANDQKFSFSDFLSPVKKIFSGSDSKKESDSVLQGTVQHPYLLTFADLQFGDVSMMSDGTGEFTYIEKILDILKYGPEHNDTVTNDSNAINTKSLKIKSESNFRPMKAIFFIPASQLVEIWEQDIGSTTTKTVTQTVDNDSVDKVQNDNIESQKLILNKTENLIVVENIEPSSDDNHKWINKSGMGHHWPIPDQLLLEENITSLSLKVHSMNLDNNAKYKRRHDEDTEQILSGSHSENSKGSDSNRTEVIDSNSTKILRILQTIKINLSTTFTQDHWHNNPESRNFDSDNHRQVYLAQKKQIRTQKSKEFYKRRRSILFRLVEDGHLIASDGYFQHYNELLGESESQKSLGQTYARKEQTVTTPLPSNTSTISAPLSDQNLRSQLYDIDSCYSENRVQLLYGFQERLFFRLARNESELQSDSGMNKVLLSKYSERGYFPVVPDVSLEGEDMEKQVKKIILMMNQNGNQIQNDNHNGNGTKSDLNVLKTNVFLFNGKNAAKNSVNSLPAILRDLTTPDHQNWFSVTSENSWRTLMKNHWFNTKYSQSQSKSQHESSSVSGSESESDWSIFERETCKSPKTKKNWKLRPWCENFDASGLSLNIETDDGQSTQSTTVVTTSDNNNFLKNVNDRSLSKSTQQNDTKSNSLSLSVSEQTQNINMTDDNAASNLTNSTQNGTISSTVSLADAINIADTAFQKMDESSKSLVHATASKTNHSSETSDNSTASVANVTNVTDSDSESDLSTGDNHSTNKKSKFDNDSDTVTKESDSMTKGTTATSTSEKEKDSNKLHHISDSDHHKGHDHEHPDKSKSKTVTGKDGHHDKTKTENGSKKHGHHKKEKKSGNHSDHHHIHDHDHDHHKDKKAKATRNHKEPESKTGSSSDADASNTKISDSTIVKDSESESENPSHGRKITIKEDTSDDIKTDSKLGSDSKGESSESGSKKVKEKEITV